MRAWWRRWRERSRRLRTGYMDAPCDNCDGGLGSTFHVLRVRRRRLVVACAPCAGDLRAAGAELIGVYS